MHTYIYIYIHIHMHILYTHVFIIYIYMHTHCGVCVCVLPRQVVILAMEYRGFGRSDDAEISEESMAAWRMDLEDSRGEGRS